jgi:hypothetical protein
MDRSAWQALPAMGQKQGAFFVFLTLGEAYFAASKRDRPYNTL